MTEKAVKDSDHGDFFVYPRMLATASFICIATLLRLKQHRRRNVFDRNCWSRYLLPLVSLIRSYMSRQLNC